MADGLPPTPTAPPTADRPLTIWAVTDGRVGIEAQAMGLAEAVARLRPAEIAVRRVGWRWGLAVPPFTAIPQLFLEADAPIVAPWPDIWIGAGRASLPLSRRIRRWSGGATFVVQTQDPRGGLGDFDFVAPPIHDAVAGPNVFPMIGSPTRAHAEGFRRDLARFKARIEPLPHPRIAMVVGGKSKTHDLPPGRARAMAAEVGRAVRAAGGSLLLSYTRRTPAPARAILTAALGDIPGWIWDDRDADAGENPYFAFLAAADHILVTEDSTNLAADAAATGRPVHVLAMAGGGRKFDRFHAELAKRGVSRRFGGAFEAWSYPPLDETNAAARELLRRFDERKPF